MNIPHLSIEDLSKLSQQELINYALKLQASNGQRVEGIEQLHINNHKLNAEINAIKKENAKLRKELEIKNDYVSKFLSVVSEFFVDLFKIFEQYYGFISWYENLDLGKQDMQAIKQNFKQIADSTQEMYASRMLAVTTSLNASKSGTNNGNIVAAIDGPFMNSANALLDIRYDDGQKARFAEFNKALELVEQPITDFAPNCQLVKAKYDVLRDTTSIGNAIKPVFDGIDTDQSLANSITKQDLFVFADTYIQPFCVPRSRVSTSAMEPKPVIELIAEKVNKIKDSDVCLEAGEKEFTRVCPHCGKKCTAKLEEIKYHNQVLASIFPSKNKRCLVPAYIVECTECHHKQTLSLLEMNIEKLLNAACAPYLGENCVLFDKKASIMDKLRFVAKQNQTQDVLDALNAHDEGIAHINELTSRGQNNNYQRTLGNILASDVKHQSHPTAIISAKANKTSSAFMPAFKNSKISIAMHANKLAAQHCQGSMSKNHMVNTFFNQEELLSHSRLMESDIEFSRAYLSGVAHEIKNELLSESTSIHVDESPVKLVCPSNKDNSGETAGWLCGMASSMTSKHSMVYMEACESRATSNFLPFSEYDAQDAFIARKVHSNAYTAYLFSKTASNGEPITFAGSFSQCRGPLHLSFAYSNLLKIYNEKLLPAKADITDFLGNLKKVCNNPAYDLNLNQVLLLIIYYIINTLFSNDASVIDAWQDHSCQEFLDSLHKVRQEKSADLLAALNLLVELYISINNNIKLSANQRIYQTNGSESMVNKFCIYWMNLRNSLVEFINSPHFALSNNKIERSFRLPAISKQVSLSSKTIDGVKAFANHITIFENCSINKVSVKQYIPWLAANIQERINALPQSEVDEAIKRAKELFPLNADISIEKCLRPTKFTAIKGHTKDGKNITEELDIYDPRNPSIFLYDAISYEGLTPFDFSKSLSK